MSFSYDSDLAGISDQLRFLVQDTVDAGHFLEDAEIAFVAAAHSGLYRAAAVLCRTIAAKVLRDPGYKDNALFYDAEAKAAEYIKLAESFEQQYAAGSTLTIDPGAFSANIAPLESYQSGEPAFTRDLHIHD